MSGRLLSIATLTTAIALLPLSSSYAQQSPTASPGEDFSGVWWAKSYSPTIRPADGSALPFTEKGKAAYEKNMAGLKDGSIKDDARRICVPDGVPRILDNPYPFQIVQTPGQVTIIYELNHVIRTVDMVKKPKDEDLEIFPYYSGHSWGNWDGDTLVINNAGFNEKTFLDATGVPHTDQLRVVERLHKINGGKQLEDTATITDPDIFTAPWTARFVYDARPDTHIQDYVCGEKHRDISKIPGVAEARRR